jgi:HD-like signal output (HDOD) protein
VLWQHTAFTSALARVIARRITHLDPDTALFTGLIHEVRGFYLISRADDFPSLLDSNVLESDEPVEAEIGDSVLERLEVPTPIREAIHAVWRGYLADPPTTFGDTVLLAKHLAPIQSPLFTSSQQQGRGTRARIDLQLESETLSQVVAECAGEIDSLSKALQF